jgi:DNA polymerase-3 subunit gamma/tau
MFDNQPEYPTEDDYQPMSYEDFAEAAPASTPQAQASVNAASPLSRSSAPEKGLSNQNVEGSKIADEKANQAAKSSAIGGLRHQLRSKRMQLSQQTDSGADTTKKSGKVDSKVSVFDRLAEKSSAAPARSLPSTSQAAMASPHKAVSPNEPYQWQPSEAAKQKQQQAKQSDKLTPAQLKHALQHERTPEMSAKLQQEALQQDTWATLISALTIPKMVEQLALNSFCEHQGTQYRLWLRPSQAHLNSEKAIEVLSEALSGEAGEACQVQVEIGEQGQTPLELKDGLYQQKLTHAYQALQQDQNIQFLQTRFGAELDSDTVRPI